MIVTKRLKLQSQGNNDIIDITPHVERVVTESMVASGSVTIFVTGSTAGITTVVFERLSGR